MFVLNKYIMRKTQIKVFELKKKIKSRFAISKEAFYLIRKNVTNMYACL